eukprot:351082-Chlamydomonas_euryale.AAC.2
MAAAAPSARAPFPPMSAVPSCAACVAGAYRGQRRHGTRAYDGTYTCFRKSVTLLLLLISCFQKRWVAP